MADTGLMKNNYKSNQAIKSLLEKCGIKKDKDVEELYLSNQDLSEVVDLTRFKFLKILWLNANKLRSINCLTNNFLLKELHLENNQLTTICGKLRHLTCLEVLMLHNNQLTKLERVAKEFNKMQTLHTLNLFDNPVSQEPGYRLLLIHTVPSLKLLDRQEVGKTETDQARRVYDQEQEKIRETIAFGRRSEGPPELYYPPGLERSRTTDIESKHIGNSYLRDNPPYDNTEEAVNARRLKKSVTVFTTFDWSKIPRYEERRQMDKPFDSPEIITHVYR
ncbi:unnamed protein product [Mytilus edulis]|uniref:Leucine-rich repeat-containing protein 72 n=1 Tax=Mytilus edulis TaxID=6550 RepID=A0A8S3QWI7_MYTED|nr:unnamed protein product [Mytilus edulis]